MNVQVLGRHRVWNVRNREQKYKILKIINLDSQQIQRWADWNRMSKARMLETALGRQTRKDLSNPCISHKELWFFWVLWQVIGECFLRGYDRSYFALVPPTPDPVVIEEGSLLDQTPVKLPRRLFLARPQPWSLETTDSPHSYHQLFHSCLIPSSLHTHAHTHSKREWVTLEQTIAQFLTIQVVFLQLQF